MSEKPVSYSDFSSHYELVASDKKIGKKHQELYEKPNGGQSKAEKIYGLLHQSRLGGTPPNTSTPYTTPSTAPTTSYGSQTPTSHEFGKLPDLRPTVTLAGISAQSMVTEENSSQENYSRISTGESASPDLFSAKSSANPADTGDSQFMSAYQETVKSPLAAVNTWNFALSCATDSSKNLPTSNTAADANSWTTFR